MKPLPAEKRELASRYGIAESYVTDDVYYGYNDAKSFLRDLYLTLATDELFRQSGAASRPNPWHTPVTAGFVHKLDAQGLIDWHYRLSDKTHENSNDYLIGVQLEIDHFKNGSEGEIVARLARCERRRASKKLVAVKVLEALGL